MNANENNTPEVSQSFGLVPLFPLPQLQAINDSSISNMSISKNSSLAMTHFGNFLPPIFNRHYDNYAVEELAPIEVERILAEVIAEEVLDIYEKLFDEGGSFLDVAISHDIERQNALEERVSKAIARDILEEVVHETSQITVSNCLDDIIKSYSLEMQSRLKSERLLLEIVNVLINEIAQESIELCDCETESQTILEDTVEQEVNAVVKESLMDLGARHAFSQYKQISQFAFEHTLDGMCMDALLPRQKSASFDVDFLLDHMMFGLILSKTLEVNETRRKEPCFPLDWYQKKLLQRIVLDAALDELCEADLFETT